MAQASVNGTSLFYEQHGEGIPLLLMHGGLGLDHKAFLPYFNQLSDLTQLTYYDHRGNGRSVRDIDYSAISIESLADDAEALRQELGLGKMVLFGHSYGSFIAQVYAAKYPDNLAGLILCSAVPALDYHPTPVGDETQMAAFGAAFSRPMADDADWSNIWNTVFPMYFHQFDPAKAKMIHENTVYSAAAWNSAGPLLGTFNTLEQLPDMTMPTLIVSGAHDNICKLEPGSERIHSHMPNSEMVIFQKSGHYPFIEEEEQFFATTRNWLAKLG